MSSGVEGMGGHRVDSSVGSDLGLEIPDGKEAGPRSPADLGPLAIGNGGPGPACAPGQTVAEAAAAWRRASACSVRSQVNSGSERPKWPPLAVFR